VTRAWRSNGWVLLDNLSQVLGKQRRHRASHRAQADACVLERLNPITEQVCRTRRAHWRSLSPRQPVRFKLPEKNESKSDEDRDGGIREEADRFRIVATMTPPGPGDTAQQNKSPALANRYDVVLMDDLHSAANADELRGELEPLAAALLGVDRSDDVIGGVVVALETVRQLLESDSASRSVPRMLLRDCVRVLDVAFSTANDDTDTIHRFMEALYRMLLLPIRSRDPALYRAIEERIGQAPSLAGVDAVEPAASDDAVRTSKWAHSVLLEGYTLSASRRDYLKTIHLAWRCNQAVLLEGAAAVGKTALVEAFCLKVGQALKRHGRLERANNTDSTTVQVCCISAAPCLIATVGLRWLVPSACERYRVQGRRPRTRYARGQMVPCGRWPTTLSPASTLMEPIWPG
jgi:hypothetical protein